MLAQRDLPRKPNSNEQLTRTILQLGLGHEALKVLDALFTHRMSAEECRHTSPALLAFVVSVSSLIPSR